MFWAGIFLGILFTTVTALIATGAVVSSFWWFMLGLILGAFVMFIIWAVLMGYGVRTGQIKRNW